MKPKNPISKIQRSGNTPLHREAERRIRSLIAEPQYRAGALLPNEVSLAENLGISRHTLRLAIGRLVNEGLLVRTAGLGTRVCQRPVRTEGNAWSSFTREMARLGIEVVNFTARADWELPPAEVADKLGVDPDTPVLRLLRVRGWEGQPTVVAESWLAPSLGLTGDEDFSAPLYETIQRRSGVQPVRSEEEIAVTLAAAQIAAMLALKPGAPLLSRKRLVRDSADQVIEYNLNSYRADAYVLHLHLEAAPE
ncbi:GntR family transcriptional regulator [Haloferula sp. BvORR071]|uniref:GntR family transcriptional regulator n=1 Tax=Haloferula sp. BvORR071 TaxID=1396141 RepID=UPI000697FE12|nr:GntR family transcriptional regulator [Haloferula sp. BvORR071]